MNLKGVPPMAIDNQQNPSMSYQNAFGALLMLLGLVFSVAGLWGWNVYAREVARIDRIEQSQNSNADRLARIETKLDYLIKGGSNSNNNNDRNLSWQPAPKATQ